MAYCDNKASTKVQNFVLPHQVSWHNNFFGNWSQKLVLWRRTHQKLNKLTYQFALIQSLQPSKKKPLGRVSWRNAWKVPPWLSFSAPAARAVHPPASPLAGQTERSSLMTWTSASAGPWTPARCRRSGRPRRKGFCRDWQVIFLQHRSVVKFSWRSSLVMGWSFWYFLQNCTLSSRCVGISK